MKYNINLVTPKNDGSNLENFVASFMSDFVPLKDDLIALEDETCFFVKQRLISSKNNTNVVLMGHITKDIIKVPK